MSGETGVDRHLAALLGAVDEITDVAAAEGERTNLALAIVNTDTIEPEHRVKLAVALKPAKLPAASVKPEPGELIGRLIHAMLIENDKSAFDARLMVNWPTQEYAMRQSDAFAMMIGPETLPVAHIAPLMRSLTVDPFVQSEVVKQLSAFETVPRDAFQAIAECAQRSRINLDANGISIVQEGGASSTSVLDVLAGAGEDVSIESLRDVLRRLGEPYSIVADRGTQRPPMDNTQANRAILERLQKAGIVSSFPSGKDGRLRVNLKQP